MGKIKPVKVGDKLKLGVLGFGNKGNPYVKFQNYVIFLETKEGVQIALNQTIPIKITKVFERFGFAQIEE